MESNQPVKRKEIDESSSDKVEKVQEHDGKVETADVNTTESKTVSEKKQKQPRVSLADLLTEPSWKLALKNELQSRWFATIESELNKEYDSGKIVYPPREDIFKCLNLCPLDNIKVVIIGQGKSFINKSSHKK
jgi:hypothetical protein